MKKTWSVWLGLHRFLRENPPRRRAAREAEDVGKSEDFIVLALPRKYTGVGKTATILDASHQAGNRLVRHNMSSRVDTEDFHGSGWWLLPNMFFFCGFSIPKKKPTAAARRMPFTICCDQYKCLSHGRSRSRSRSLIHGLQAFACRWLHLGRMPKD